MHFIEYLYINAYSITSSSNIRIFEDEIANLTRQTGGDIRFDKSTIRRRIFEYSGLTELKCSSLPPPPFNPFSFFLPLIFFCLPLFFLLYIQALNMGRRFTYILNDDKKKAKA